MRGINESSRKIAEITSVIDGIAFQTNILALNAAVEAARAGEQGRGFAVVASEVRSLAGRCAEAAKEIKNLIGTSVDRVQHGTALVDKAGSTMTEVVSAIKRLTEIMGEISASSKEQSRGVAQVGEAVSLMDPTTQQNAALVEQMAAAAGTLNGQANELVEAVAVFKIAAGQTKPARSSQ
jgi:methyl-accepting chemotaxis protein